MSLRVSDSRSMISKIVDQEETEKFFHILNILKLEIVENEKILMMLQ